MSGVSASLSEMLQNLKQMLHLDIGGRSDLFPQVFVGGAVHLGFKTFIEIGHSVKTHFVSDFRDGDFLFDEEFTGQFDTLSADEGRCG